MIRLICLVTLITGPVSLLGCATIDASEAFGDVQSQLTNRIDSDIVWNQGSALDTELASRVDQLLAEPMNRATAVQIALLNNRRLQGTYEELTIAQADLVQAGLLHNPVFEGAFGFPLEGGQVELGLGVAQDFLDVFLIPLRKRIAEAAFEGAKWRITSQVMMLTAEVEQAFVEHQANIQMIEMYESVTQATNASYDAAQRLYDAGNITKLDLANERALYENSRLNLATAMMQRDASREHLNALLGLWGDQINWSIVPRLPEPMPWDVDLAAVERDAVAQSVDLAASLAEIDTLSNRLGFERSTSWAQELEVGVHAEREEGHWDVGPAVVVPIPLFDQGQARVAGASAKMRRAIDEYTALAVEVRSKARAARDRYVSAKRMVEFIRDEMLPLREEITQQTLLQYNAMQVGVFDLLRAKEQQIDAGRRYVEALREYWIARTTLAMIRNGKLVDSGPMRMSMPAMSGGMSSGDQH